MKGLFIAFVGMSNVGKSYWSNQLADDGYHRLDCDEMIRQQLEAVLPNTSGDGMQKLADWMGTPNDARYAETSSQYLDLQDKVLDNALSTATLSSAPIVLDTPGSIVYSNAAVIDKMRRTADVIYLEAPATAAETMFKRFQETPKPLIWRDAVGDTLKDRYFCMLEKRAVKYREMSHVIIPYEVHSRPGISIKDLLP